MLILVMDAQKQPKWVKTFLIYGMNAMTVFPLFSLLPHVLELIKLQAPIYQN